MTKILQQHTHIDSLELRLNVIAQRTRQLFHGLKMLRRPSACSSTWMVKSCWIEIWWSQVIARLTPCTCLFCQDRCCFTPEWTQKSDGRKSSQSYKDWNWKCLLFGWTTNYQLLFKLWSDLRNIIDWKTGVAHPDHLQPTACYRTHTSSTLVDRAT